MFFSERDAVRVIIDSPILHHKVTETDEDGKEETQIDDPGDVHFDYDKEKNEKNKLRLVFKVFYKSTLFLNVKQRPFITSLKTLLFLFIYSLLNINPALIIGHFEKNNILLTLFDHVKFFGQLKK